MSGGRWWREEERRNNALLVQEEEENPRKARLLLNLTRIREIKTFYHRASSPPAPRHHRRSLLSPADEHDCFCSWSSLLLTAGIGSSVPFPLTLDQRGRWGCASES